MKFLLYDEEMRRRLMAMGFTHLRYGRALDGEAVLMNECENVLCAEIVPLRNGESGEHTCFGIDSSMARQSTMDAMTSFYIRVNEDAGSDRREPVS
jgi:hypothetical protein